MAVAIGRRNTLVTIQRRTSVTDTQGGAAWTWATLAREWVLIEPVSARESALVEQMTGTVSTVVTMNFRDDLSVKDRIINGSRTLEIESIQDPTAYGEELRVLCIEVTA